MFNFHAADTAKHSRVGITPQVFKPPAAPTALCANMGWWCADVIGAALPSLAYAAMASEKRVPWHHAQVVDLVEPSCADAAWHPQVQASFLSTPLAVALVLRSCGFFMHAHCTLHALTFTDNRWSFQAWLEDYTKKCYRHFFAKSAGALSLETRLRRPWCLLVRANCHTITHPFCALCSIPARLCRWICSHSW